MGRLREKPATFKELREQVGLSPPVLTKYLKDLENQNIITRNLVGRRRIEYQLSQRGKAVELMKTSALTAGFRAAGALVHDSSSAELFLSMARMAKENPPVFQLIVDFALDVGLLTTSNPAFESRWLRILGGDKEEYRPFEEEIRKRLSKSQPQPNTPEELKAALDDLLIGIKQVFEAGKERRTRQ